VRRTDFLKSHKDWEDADVVFFDTSFGLHGGVDEGAMVMALETHLVKLQPGSFAIIVTVKARGQHIRKPGSVERTPHLRTRRTAATARLRDF
jgi:hypothetical protein